ncbi:MAG: hypothetical protein AAF596_05540, partial [Planctomycetota bacterium]
RTALATRRLAATAAATLRSKSLERIAKSNRLKEWAYYEPLSEYLFPWAVGHAAKRYGEPAARATEASRRRAAERVDQE